MIPNFFITTIQRQKVKIKIKIRTGKQDFFSPFRVKFTVLVNFF